MSLVHDTPGAVLVRYADAERVGAGRVATLLLADSDTTGGAISANRAILQAGVDGPPPHLHRASSEIFFVLDGSLTALAGDRVLALEKGDFLLVPPSMPHAFGASPGCAADVLIVFSPAALRRFDYFRLVDRVMTGRAAPQEILRTQDRFDNHFVESRVWRNARSSDAAGFIESAG